MESILQTTKKRIGIIAGGGALPRVLAQACGREGYDIRIAALRGSCEDGWTHEFETLPARPEQVGKILKFFKKAGISDVVMIGHVRRPSVRELRPDLKGLWWLWKLFLAMRTLGDDGLLRAIRGLLEQSGFALRSIQDFVADILAPEGQLGSHAMPDDAAEDVKKGLVLSQMIGRLDIGQSVVVQQGLVLGLEAVEGTDALIFRCAPLRRAGRGPVLVKTAKPQQDRALDLPTLGPDTVRNAMTGNFAGIAYSAGSVLMADVPTMVDLADAAGMFLVGIDMASLKDAAE